MPVEKDIEDFPDVKFKPVVMKVTMEFEFTMTSQEDIECVDGFISDTVDAIENLGVDGTQTKQKFVILDEKPE